MTLLRLALTVGIVVATGCATDTTFRAPDLAADDDGTAPRLILDERDVGTIKARAGLKIPVPPGVGPVQWKIVDGGEVLGQGTLERDQVVILFPALLLDRVGPCKGKPASCEEDSLTGLLHACRWTIFVHASEGRRKGQADARYDGRSGHGPCRCLACSRRSSLSFGPTVPPEMPAEKDRNQGQT